MHGMREACARLEELLVKVQYTTMKIAGLQRAVDVHHSNKSLWLSCAMFVIRPLLQKDPIILQSLHRKLECWRVHLDGNDLETGTIDPRLFPATLAERLQGADRIDAACEFSSCKPRAQPAWTWSECSWLFSSVLLCVIYSSQLVMDIPWMLIKLNTKLWLTTLHIHCSQPSRCLDCMAAGRHLIRPGTRCELKNMTGHCSSRP